MSMMMPQDPLDLQLSSYDFDLPPDLVASRPPAQRDEARLLVYERKNQKITHARFKDLYLYLPADSLLVLNNSKVFPCRLLGHKKTGARVEVFFLSLTPTKRGGLECYQCLVRTSGKKHVGDELLFPEALTLQIVEKLQDSFYMTPKGVENFNLSHYLEKNALMPIPPYIREGQADSQDKEDYQTVFAKHSGSVAAPTAGLHFTQDLLGQLEKQGHPHAYVTLHVGAGTFAPVKSASLLDHQMHAENFFVEECEWQKITQYRTRLVAVGTTSLRVLESCLNEQGEWDYAPGTECSTNIFLYPGKEIRSIQGLITNFHLPRSTLLMLVSALLGRNKTLELYKLAVNEGYRFFSYGDAMLIL